MASTIPTISHNGLTWLNISKQSKESLSTIKKQFGLMDQDIQESLPTTQRPKMVKRPGYYFIILHFPVFDRQTKRLGFAEVDFFLSSQFFITVHNGKLDSIENFFKECMSKSGVATEYFSGSSAHLFLELLNRLCESIFPILLHINEDIDGIDEKLFSDIPDRTMAEEVLRLKTNVVSFRRTMQGHKTVLDRFVSEGGRELGLFSHQDYIFSLRESFNEIWHVLESAKESINALHETNESLINLHTNDVMKTLTIISVVTFPLTLIATIFAIHAPGTPFIQNELGFWIIFVLIVIGGLAMVILFKKRRWL
jgi:magnesium transporter